MPAATDEIIFTAAASPASVPSPLGDFFALIRLRITIAVTLTTALGCILFTHRLTPDLLLVTLGLFLLACGSSALNQVQEVATDALMPRTQNRPLPAGRMTRSRGLLLAGILLALGINILATVSHHPLTVVSLSVFSILWYNGIYTNLKKMTAFAVVPGALIGALPPLIGYVAAGGFWDDPRILWVAGFFFIWQIPHFWLLVLHYGEEYVAAGLPSLTQIFRRDQLARLTFMWLIATVVCGVFMTTQVPIDAPWNLVVLIASTWLAVRASLLLRDDDTAKPIYMPLFLRINVYCLALMICLAFGTS